MTKNTPENIWSNCLTFIKDNISEQSFKTWFLPIKPIKLKGQILHIQVPSKFFYEWIEEHYIKLLKTAIGIELGEDAKLVYSIVMENTYGNTNPYTVKVPSKNRPPLNNPKVAVPVEIAAAGVKNPFVIPGLKKVHIESQLNPRDPALNHKPGAYPYFG